MDGWQLRCCYFSDPRDIALGLSTDGFAPFRQRKMTAWPIIVYNFNLPPDIRFHREYILCLGVVPGPNKPKDFDSFLLPAVEEFLRLCNGRISYLFILSYRARLSYLITALVLSLSMAVA